VKEHAKLFNEVIFMKRIKTIETRDLNESTKNGGCGECQTSCQSACKTSCGVANQPCENKKTADKK
jgi:predicted ribosomally synthesized six-cysteine peptide SCIFF